MVHVLQFELFRKEHMELIPVDVYERSVTPDKEGKPNFGQNWAGVGGGILKLIMRKMKF